MTQNLEYLILVDEHDQQQGVADKMTVHQQGWCHRAFSVFVVNQDVTGTQILLQQRQADKYHCGGLWTNACCGHPRPNESILQASRRRLYEEMGLDLEQKWLGKFHYVAPFDNGLIENEVDHVLVAFYEDEMIQPNSQEVSDYQWMEITELQNQLTSNQVNLYTPWLRQALQLALPTIKGD